MQTSVESASAREQEGIPPARDLFDGDLPTGGVRPPLHRATQASPTGSRSAISFTRMTSGLVLAGGAGILLRFPGWMTMGALCAVVIGEAFAEWPRINRLYWAGLLSALCAQATSIFITPFTWPMRFGFFFAFLGALVSFYGAQTKDLS
jgi:hypothetical protein